MSLFKTRKPADHRAIQALLVVSNRPLPHDDAVAFLQQIMGEQHQRGHEMTEHSTADFMAASDPDDPKYLYEAFARVAGPDLVDRTDRSPFKASNGCYGWVYLLFDRSLGN